MLVEVVEHDLGVVPALDLEYDAQAGAVALVADIANSLDLLLVDQFRRLLDQAGLVDLIRHFADHDCGAILAQLLDIDLGAHHDVPAARGIGLTDARRAAQNAARGEVRPLDHRDDALESRLGVLDQLDRGVDEFAKVVRRDVGRHAHRDAVGAIDQQVRRGSCQALGLLGGIVIVGPEVDRVHVDVLQQRLRIRGESRLRVAHGGGRVAIEGSEVPLPGHQQLAHAERLGHAHERLVDGRIAVRVVLAHHLANDPGALARRPIRPQPLFAHGVEDAPLHRLESVPDVGQGAPDDDRHRIVEIRLAHLVLNVNRADVPIQVVGTAQDTLGIVRMVFRHSTCCGGSPFIIQPIPPRAAIGARGGERVIQGNLQLSCPSPGAALSKRNSLRFRGEEPETEVLGRHLRPRRDRLS